jgi:hypothetical protein
MMAGCSPPIASSDVHHQRAAEIGQLKELQAALR